MTDVEDRLREIRERWAKAPRGPWDVDLDGVNGKVHRIGPVCGYDYDSTNFDPDHPAVAAIAHAPTDIAYLLAEIDRLRSQVDDVCDEVSAFVTDDATPAQAVADAIATNREVSVRHGYTQAREQAAALCAKRGASIHPLSERDLRHVADAIRTMTPGDGGGE